MLPSPEQCGYGSTQGPVSGEDVSASFRSPTTMLRRRIRSRVAPCRNNSAQCLTKGSVWECALVPCVGGGGEGLNGAMAGTDSDRDRFHESRDRDVSHVMTRLNRRSPKRDAVTKRSNLLSAPSHSFACIVRYLCVLFLYSF